jgi:hypothetical protein
VDAEGCVADEQRGTHPAAVGHDIAIRLFGEPIGTGSHVILDAPNGLMTTWRWRG